VLCAGWSGLPILEEPGPRYVIPALPFLVVPLAVLWDRLWRPMLLAAIVGAAVSLPATTTFILLGIHQGPFPEFLTRVRNGDFAPAVWPMAFGRGGVVLYLATVTLVIVAIARAGRDRTREVEPAEATVSPATPVAVRT